MAKKKMTVCILIALILIMVFVGYVTQGNDKTPDSQTTEHGTRQEASANPTQSTEDPLEALEYIAVETPFGTLRYQEQWVDYMKTTQVSQDDTVEVRFSAVIGETEYPLFCVTIGGDAQDPVGQLTDAQGTKRNVYINFEDVQIPSEMEQSEQSRLYAMMEEVNYILENLK